LYLLQSRNNLRFAVLALAHTALLPESEIILAYVRIQGSRSEQNHSFCKKEILAIHLVSDCYLLFLIFFYKYWYIFPAEINEEAVGCFPLKLVIAFAT
ncbi:hypothetical protein, partial [Granulicella sp. S190]|uniref:hypothetical protein n=1 Tax=Granulicella sp. S190 TaxID=1747226 RepID=UPI001C20446D